jgi:hypothetical protein
LSDYTCELGHKLKKKCHAMKCPHLLKDGFSVFGRNRKTDRQTHGRDMNIAKTKGMTFEEMMELEE